MATSERSLWQSSMQLSRPIPSSVYGVGVRVQGVGAGACPSSSSECATFYGPRPEFGLVLRCKSLNPFNLYPSRSRAVCAEGGTQDSCPVSDAPDMAITREQCDTRAGPPRISPVF